MKTITILIILILAVAPRQMLATFLTSHQCRLARTRERQYFTAPSKTHLRTAQHGHDSASPLMAKKPRQSAKIRLQQCNCPRVLTN